MSAEKRRNMLYVFAGVVIALLAVIAFVSPRFRSEDASGAIGAVQKHRAPQIKQADVVLGDEQFRNAQKILYGDIMTDAAALQNASANIAVGVRSVNAQASLAAVEQALEARSAELRSRYMVAAQAQADALGVKLNARNEAQLAAREMAEMNARLGPAIMGLDSRTPAQYLQSMDVDLAAMQAKFAANRADMAAAQAQLAQFDAALAARVDARASLLARQPYLASLADEAAALESAESALAELMSKNVNAADRAQLASADDVAAQLASEAAQLESKALKSMELQLASDSESMEALAHSVQALDSMKQLAASRSLAANAEQLQSFDAALASCRANLANRQAILSSHAALALRTQLAAIEEQMQNRSALAGHLASLQNEEQLASRIANNAALQQYSAHLASINQAANRANLASALPDAQGFAAEVRTLMDRSVNMQSRHAK